MRKVLMFVGVVIRMTDNFECVVQVRKMSLKFIT